MTDQPGTGQDDVAPRVACPLARPDREPGQHHPRERSPDTGVDPDGEPPDTGDDEIVPL